ncbi:MAG: chain length-determining protein [Nitrosomonadales bacterium]|nr:chain length-determining protein [Nitrosomonadales bacterium]
MDELVTQLLSHIRGIWKYRWYAVATIWLVAVVGWLITYTLPDSYESSARIYVDTQNILQPLMAGIASTPNLEQQVTIMSRTLISRPNVERVIRMIDLDIQTKTATDRENLINELTKEIKIQSTGRDNLYTISYQNKNPKIAKDVVQSLLTIFVEGSLGDKKQDTTSAIRFIDEQIKDYQEKLVTAETALKVFKQKNVGLMPGEGRDYVTQLTAAADNLNQAKLELREAEQSRAAIKRQISGDDPSLTTDVAPDSNFNPEIDARIQTLTKNLDALRLNYTEQHPDVISTKRLIAALEARKKEEAKLNKRSADPGKNYSPMLQQLNVALAEAEARAAAMSARVAEYSSRYNYLKSMSKAVPEVEADLAQLNRDYEVNKSNYEKLLERREAAKMSGEMDTTTELVSFRIIDPPTTPQLPTGPNLARLFSLVLLGAIASGLGIAFLISQIRPTFHSQASIREITGRPVLGAVAMIWTDQELVKQKREVYILSLSMLFLLALYGLLIAKAILRAAPS